MNCCEVSKEDVFPETLSLLSVLINDTTLMPLVFTEYICQYIISVFWEYFPVYFPVLDTLINEITYRFQENYLKVLHALCSVPVSYTHLDVYKRQYRHCQKCFKHVVQVGKTFTQILFNKIL